MSLSDIVSRLGVEAAPKLALLLFLAAFAMILIGALARSRRCEFDDASRLPLTDDDPPGVDADHDKVAGSPLTVGRLVARPARTPSPEVHR